MYTRSKTKKIPPPPNEARPHYNSVGSISSKEPEPRASCFDRVRVRVGIRVRVRAGVRVRVRVGVGDV